MPDICFNKTIKIPYSQDMNIQNIITQNHLPMMSCLIDADSNQVDKPYFINDMIYLGAAEKNANVNHPTTPYCCPNVGLECPADKIGVTECTSDNPEIELYFSHQCCRLADIKSLYTSVDEI